MSSSPSWANARKSFLFIRSPASVNRCVYILIFEGDRDGSNANE